MCLLPLLTLSVAAGTRADAGGEPVSGTDPPASGQAGTDDATTAKAAEAATAVDRSQLTPNPPPAGDAEAAANRLAAGKDYGELLQLGIAEFSNANWVEARVLFSHAHALNPNARTLRSLGMVEFELRNYPAAIQALRAALSDPRNPLTDAQRGSAEELLAQAHLYVGSVEIQVAGDAPDLQVFVDGSPLSLVDGAARLRVGRHEIRARRPGHPDQVRVVQIQSGATEVVQFSFSGAPPPAAVAVAADATAATATPAGPSASTATADHDDSAGGGTPWAPIAIASGGGALLIASLVTGAAASGKESDLEHLCGGAAPCLLDRQQDVDRGTQLQEDADSLAATSTGLLVAGGLVATAGLVWLAITLSDSESGPRATAAPVIAPGFAGLNLRARL